MLCRGVYPQQKIEKTVIGRRKTGGKKKYDKESRERISSSMDERSFLAGLRGIQAIDVLQLVQKSLSRQSVCQRNK
jgi:hypothetical protein